ncbi:MAG: hypothetical protein JRE28_13075 [Deltaproteobacteria bacterium]|nr:hypothetical protein [Deltaproteobacteria bacterium]
MRKKSLGRGLDDISDIFLSTRKDKEMRNGFSSKKLRDATCEFCSHIINDSNNASKCKIFTLNNEKYGVRYMDTVSLTSGSYCQYFDPVFQEKADGSFVDKETSSDNTKIECDIEENVIVRRNITYANTPEAQKDILKSLSKHLEKNYDIKSIELGKTDRISQPGMKKITEESVTIFIDGEVKGP